MKQDPTLDLTNRLALSIDEAAAALGVSEATIRSMLPRLPHVHLGRRVVLPVDALRDWLCEVARTEQRRMDRSANEILRQLNRGPEGRRRSASGNRKSPLSKT